MDRLLKYYTRGNSNPQGKPRVYFCCHPKDFNGYFQEIADEILELQNCAIYYYPPEAEVPEQERELDLGQMNLVVVPVTSRLLYTDNQAMADVAFAMERKIPVLPLMQEEHEEHLEEIYNKKFEGLHFLNKHDPDPTALPYQEKLKKYLEAVLIGDELAQQIREAFDAYIFLSYRKKDRKYAQELMQLIHRNDFCRDIAIWYDEFLTPGEEFSDAIQQALDKSKLFTLVVTDHLLEPGNYVMTTEFPMARDSGKPILPAQMTEVDPQALAKDYQDIPPCADARDESLLRQALLNALENEAKREHDPRHNFFIGLAYLGGVDVEKDSQRALELITGAAEAGLPEAIQKLVTMYETGEGVTRNYQTAISWQEKLVAQCRELFREEPSREAYEELWYAFFDLGGYRKAVGDLAGAEGAYMELRTLALAQSEVFDTRRALSVSEDMIGIIAFERGRLEEAERHYQEALKINKALAEETKTVEALRRLSVSYNNLGTIAQAQGQLNKANNCYQKAVVIDKALAEETKTVEALRDLSVSYNNLGFLAKSRGQLDEAEDYCRKNLNISEALAEETNTVEARRNLSGSYNNMGIIAEARGQLDEAYNWYRKSLELREALAEETNTVGARRDLSASYYNLGSIAQERRQLDEAHDWHQKALELHEALAEETNTVEARRNLSLSYHNLGVFARARGQLDEASNWYQKALELREALAEETNTVEARSDLSVSYNHLGGIAQARRRLDEAYNWYRKALEIGKALAEETNTAEARSDLSLSYYNLGIIAQAVGQLDAAYYWFRNALELREDLAEETNTVEARRDLSVSYNTLGTIAQARRRLDVAEDYYRKALEIRKALAEETGTAKSLADLGNAYIMLGTINGSNLKMFQKAYDIYQLLTEAFPGVSDFQDMRNMLHKRINKQR